MHDFPVWLKYRALYCKNIMMISKIKGPKNGLLRQENCVHHEKGQFNFKAFFLVLFPMSKLTKLRSQIVTYNDYVISA